MLFSGDIECDDNNKTSSTFAVDQKEIRPYADKIRRCDN